MGPGSIPPSKKCFSHTSGYKVEWKELRTCRSRVDQCQQTHFLHLPWLASALPRLGTILSGPDPRPQMESTLPKFLIEQVELNCTGATPFEHKHSVQCQQTQLEIETYFNSDARGKNRLKQTQSKTNNIALLQTNWSRMRKNVLQNAFSQFKLCVLGSTISL